MAVVLKRLAGALVFLLAAGLGLGIVGACLWFVAGGLVQVLGVFGVHASREAAAWLLGFASSAIAGLRGFK